MKNYLYDVVFGIEHYEVYAGNPTDAAILAVAKRISEGKSTDFDQLYDCEREDNIIFEPCKLIVMPVD